MIFEDIFRETPSGTGIAGVAATVRRVAGDALVGSAATTDGTASGAGATFPGKPRGYFRVRVDGSPGDVYWEATYNGALRRRYSVVSGPTGVVQLGELHHVLRAMGNGVIAGALAGLPVGAAGTGMTVDVGTGAALVAGVNYTNHAADALPIAANGGTDPRIDLVVVRVKPKGASADEGRSLLAVREGTPAPSPTPPNPTQTAETFELPLAEVLVAAGASSIGADKVTDERAYVLSGVLVRNPVVEVEARRIAMGEQEVGAGNTAILPANPVLLAGVVYDVSARAGVLASKGTAESVEIAPYIGGTGNAAPFRGHDVGYTEITNGHHLTVTGTGGPLACGVLIRRNGGGAAAWKTGALSVQAIPRT